MNTTLRKLVGQCVWANRQLFDYLVAEKIENPAIWRLACHIANGETAWFQRIRGEAVNPEIFRIYAADELGRILSDHQSFYEALLSSDLSRIIAYRRFNGDEYQSSVEDILLHLCTHGFHHRAQIASMLSKDGKKPPNLDFINFCRLSGL